MVKLTTNLSDINDHILRGRSKPARSHTKASSGSKRRSPYVLTYLKHKLGLNTTASNAGISLKDSISWPTCSSALFNNAVTDAPSLWPSLPYPERPVALLPKRYAKSKPTTTPAKPPKSNDLVNAVHTRVLQTIDQYSDDAFSESSTQYYHLMMVLQTLQMANANGWCHPVHRVYRHKVHMAQNSRQVNHDFLKPRAQPRPLHVVS